MLFWIGLKTSAKWKWRFSLKTNWPETKCFWPSFSDLFVQNIWSFQSPFWVATCQNWLPVHFSTSMHVWRLCDVATAQWGKLSHTIKSRWKKNTCKKKKKLWNLFDSLLITGWSMHHGDEENLPKTESKRSMCQGQRAV